MSRGVHLGHILTEETQPLPRAPFGAVRAKKRGGTAGELCSAGAPAVCIGLELTSRIVPQLSSNPSLDPLSSAMHAGWHTLGEGLKASPGC